METTRRSFSVSSLLVPELETSIGVGQDEKFSNFGMYGSF
jgi:hypothetical protein